MSDRYDLSDEEGDGSNLDESEDYTRFVAELVITGQIEREAAQEATHEATQEAAQEAKGELFQQESNEESEDGKISCMPYPYGASSSQVTEQLTDDLVVEYLRARGLIGLADEVDRSMHTVDQNSVAPEQHRGNTKAVRYPTSHSRTLAQSDEDIVENLELGMSDSTIASESTAPSRTTSSVVRRETIERSAFVGVGAYAVSRESSVEIPSDSIAFDLPAPIDRTTSAQVEATRVDDIVRVTAKPFEESKWTPKTVSLVVFAAMALLTIIVISVATTQSNKNDYGPESVPTLSPSVSPDTRLAVITDIVANVSGLQSTSGAHALHVVGSPQHKALQWIALDDDNHVDMEDEDRIIQRYTLAVLYYSTGGANWTNQFEFMTEDDECAWSGALQCDSNGIITDIDLRENELIGPMPHELSALTELKSLIFDTNSLTGQLPTIFQELTSLTRFDLWSNELMGSIPSGYFAMTNLESFKVGRNGITGSIPSEIGFLTKMTVLSLEQNLLTGQMPESLWDLTDMRVFDADQQSLSGTVSPKVGKWLNMTHFAFLKLEISGTVRRLGSKMSSLFAHRCSHKYVLR